MINAVANVEVVLSTALVWSFVIAYHLCAAWYRSTAGRLVMLTNTVFGLVLTLASARVLFPHIASATWFEVLRVLLFSGVPVVFTAQLILLYRRQVRPSGRERMRSPDRQRPEVR